MCRATHTNITHEGDFGACVDSSQTSAFSTSKRTVFSVSVAQKRSTESLAVPHTVEYGKPWVSILRWVNRYAMTPSIMFSYLTATNGKYLAKHHLTQRQTGVRHPTQYCVELIRTLDDKQWGTHISPLLLRDSFNVATDNPR